MFPKSDRLLAFGGDDDHTPSGYKIEDFYFLSRATLVKDEKHYDKVSVPPLIRALLKNEQDVTLFEKLVFMQSCNR